jgi:hypothetical protein
MWAPERKSGVSHSFSVWRTYATLPVNAMGLSLTYSDTRCALRDKLATVTCTILPVHRPQCCDTVRTLILFVCKERLTPFCPSAAQRGRCFTALVNIIYYLTKCEVDLELWVGIEGIVICWKLLFRCRGFGISSKAVVRMSDSRWLHASTVRHSVVWMRYFWATMFHIAVIWKIEWIER